MHRVCVQGFDICMISNRASYRNIPSCKRFQSHGVNWNVKFYYGGMIIIPNQVPLCWVFYINVFGNSISWESRSIVNPSAQNVESQMCGFSCQSMWELTCWRLLYIEQCKINPGCWTSYKAMVNPQGLEQIQMTKSWWVSILMMENSILINSLANSILINCHVNGNDSLR